MKRGKAIQICGTGSGVGKSIIVAGLCRIFLQDGYKVAPFKAQNMALNSFVTKEEGEIGRAQAMQALACKIEPSVDMNPVLIKPNSDTGAQVIVRGKPHGNMNARRYINFKHKLKKIVKESFNKLINENEIVVMEGAGSPAEINLKSHDIVNLKMAEYAKAPVILVGDIDKGGVFAWVVGTVELLTKKEKAMIKGIIINKFRGDKTLLAPGIKFLEKRTGIKVLGVLPYFKNIKIPEEDSVPLEHFLPKILRPAQDTSVLRTGLVNIDVIYLPHISNFTDFDALEQETDVALKYIKRAEELDSPDVIIIPGSKNTVADLRYLKKTGLAQQIISAITSKPATVLFGICGGYQMLGRKINDKYSLESNAKEIDGLGLLPVNTVLGKKKILAQIKAKEITSGLEISGYEIHHGSSKAPGDYSPIFEISEHNGKRVKYFDGAKSKDGRIFGTYIHGLFDCDIFRRNWLNRIRQRKGWPALVRKSVYNPDKEFNKLAKLIRENMDIDLLYKILGS